MRTIVLGCDSFAVITTNSDAPDCYSFLVAGNTLNSIEGFKSNLSCRMRIIKAGANHLGPMLILRGNKLTLCATFVTNFFGAVRVSLAEVQFQTDLTYETKPVGTAPPRHLY